MTFQVGRKSILFNAEFQELFDSARPFMSEFQIIMVTKLARTANEDISIDRQREKYEECLNHIGESYLNFLMRTSREISPDLPSHLRRLRGFVDQLINEAASDNTKLGTKI